MVDSLKVVVKTLREQLEETKPLLEEERNQNTLLKETLREELWKETDSFGEVESKLKERGIRQIYPQGDLQRAKEAVENPPHMYPLVKTEYLYESDSNNRPQIVTKETPFTVTELAKLRKDFSRTPRESETEYVWKVSLSGGDEILLSEKEAEGYCGPGVFLTTSNNQAPWSLTQRAAYWAGGLNPLERGDPLAITGTVDQLVESIQKAACLQMMYDRKLDVDQVSPMLIPVDPEWMTPLIRGLPDSLKPIGIQLQGKIENAPVAGRITWGEVAQELINFGRKYGPVGGSWQRPETRAVRAAGKAEGQSVLVRRGQDSKLIRFSGPGRERLLSRQEWWQLGLRRGVPRDLTDGLPTQKLEKLVQSWPERKVNIEPTPSTPPSISLREKFDEGG